MSTNSVSRAANDFRAASGLPRRPVPLADQVPDDAPPRGPGLFEVVRGDGETADHQRPPARRCRAGPGLAPGAGRDDPAGPAGRRPVRRDAQRAVQVHLRGQAAVAPVHDRGGVARSRHGDLHAPGPRPGHGRAGGADRAGADRGLRARVGRAELRRGGRHLAAQRGRLRRARRCSWRSWWTGSWR